MCTAPKITKIGMLAGLAAAMLLSACGGPAGEEAPPSAGGKSTAAAIPARIVVSDDALIAKIDAVFVSEFKRFDITIAAEKGEVTLGGFALNKKQADRALEIARMIDGVSKVTDNISLYPLDYILQ